MLDIKFIRENKEKVADAAAKKGAVLNLDALLEIDAQRVALMQEIEELNSLKNDINDLIKQAKDESERAEIIEKGKEIKTKLEEKEPRYKEIKQMFETFMVQVPNVMSDDVPE